MESIEVNGLTYVTAPERERGSCRGCVAFTNENDDLCDEICNTIKGSCLEREAIWVRKVDVQKQIELNTVFGQKPLTYQILEHTDEEEEAWQEAQKKVATGVTDGPAERAMREATLPPEMHRQVGGTHYFNPIQPWDIIRAWELNYWEGNIVKYVLRHKGKNKVEDLEKARHYLDCLIENYDELYPVSN